MAVDISKVFKSNIKAIRMNQCSDDKENILNEELLRKNNKKNQNKISIANDAKNIISNITLLKNFLNENKSLYLQPDYLISQNDINEIEFQNFEDQAEDIIKKCNDAIQTLKKNAYKNIHKSQHQEHLDNMFYLIDRYLKDVCKIYSEQKAIRVQRILQKKKFAQLCSPEIDLLQKSKDSNKIKETNQNHDDEDMEKYKSIESGFSEQELLTLERENELLYENLVQQSEEIRQIESDVIEVSKLTQMFTENIVSQLNIVENIQKSAVETNTNLTKGNENITEAMKKNAALRLWVLFIIIVLSFTLLFLDWFND